MINIGNNIREMRIKKKMTQQELGDKLYVSDKTVSSWESSRTEPDINILSDVAKALDCSFLSLVFDNGAKICYSKALHKTFGGSYV